MKKIWERSFGVMTKRRDFHGSSRFCCKAIWRFDQRGRSDLYRRAEIMTPGSEMHLVFFINAKGVI